MGTMGQRVNLAGLTVLLSFLRAALWLGDVIVAPSFLISVYESRVGQPWTVVSEESSEGIKRFFFLSRSRAHSSFPFFSPSCQFWANTLSAVSPVGSTRDGDVGKSSAREKWAALGFPVWELFSPSRGVSPSNFRDNQSSPRLFIGLGTF